jgi:hypothetical protein
MSNLGRFIWENLAAIFIVILFNASTNFLELFIPSFELDGFYSQPAPYLLSVLLFGFYVIPGLLTGTLITNIVFTSHLINYDFLNISLIILFSPLLGIKLMEWTGVANFKTLELQSYRPLVFLIMFSSMLLAGFELLYFLYFNIYLDSYNSFLLKDFLANFFISSFLIYLYLKLPERFHRLVLNK